MEIASHPLPPSLPASTSHGMGSDEETITISFPCMRPLFIFSIRQRKFSFCRDAHTDIPYLLHTYAWLSLFKVARRVNTICPPGHEGGVQRTVMTLKGRVLMGKCLS